MPIWKFAWYVPVAPCPCWVLPWWRCLSQGKHEETMSFRSFNKWFSEFDWTGYVIYVVVFLDMMGASLFIINMFNGMTTSVGQTDRKEPHLAKTASNKTWTNLLTYFLSNQKYGFPACSVGLPECISYIYMCILIYINICISIHASIIKALNLRQVYTRILAWLKRCTVGKGGPPILILYSRTPHEAWNFRKPQDFSFTKLVEDDALI